MALICIMVVDGPDGADVSVVMEPALPQVAGALMTPAQVSAMTMLNALSESIKSDRGLVQLLHS